jgi:hypothetical protein
VGHHSFLSQLFALILSSALGWPGAGLPVSTMEQGPTVAPAAFQLATVKAKSTRSFNRRPGLERNHCPSGGVLDDDRAIFPEDSDDGIEDRSGTVLLCLCDWTRSAPTAKGESRSSRDAASFSQSGPIHALSRFRC